MILIVNVPRNPPLWEESMVDEETSKVSPRRDGWKPSS
jgi:hypothetical protein